MAQAGLIILGSKYLAVFVPVVVIVLYLVQRIYLRTSRQLRFLDLEAKSPLFKNFTETIEGLSTIRAFNWQEDYVKINLGHLDESQKPYYLLYCIQRWLNLVMDLIIAVLATALVALAFSLRSSTSSGYLAVALTAVLTFGQYLQELLRSWTQMETSLGAIARTKNLETSVLSEDVCDVVQEPASEWPSEGCVEFNNVSASYE